MGKDVVETIRYFGARGKVWKIHFRNVSAPLPHFVETFMDNGYMDKDKITKALVENRFDGIMILDHTPEILGGRYADSQLGSTPGASPMFNLLPGAMLELGQNAPTINGL
jgi:mannonate dehydratase